MSFERIRTSMGGQSRVADIERGNKELGGFLNIFAKLSPENMQLVFEAIDRLKQVHGQGTPEFMAEVQELAKAFGAFHESVSEEIDAHLGTDVLTARMGDMSSMIGRNNMTSKNELTN